MISHQIFLKCLLLLCLYLPAQSYLIGVGRADCTGPTVEIRFMGYANIKQIGYGLHLRQFCRAFVVKDDAENRIAFVSADAGMIGYGVKREVLKRLQARYGSEYTDQNVVISGSHTHSTPGGYLMHLLYDISILGFVPQTFEALVQGIYLSIKRATENMQEGRIYLARTTVLLEVQLCHLTLKNIISMTREVFMLLKCESGNDRVIKSDIHSFKKFKTQI